MSSDELRLFEVRTERLGNELEMGPYCQVHNTE